MKFLLLSLILTGLPAFGQASNIEFQEVYKSLNVKHIHLSGRTGGMNEFVKTVNGIICVLRTKSTPDVTGKLFQSYTCYGKYKSTISETTLYDSINNAEKPFNTITNSRSTTLKNDSTWLVIKSVSIIPNQNNISWQVYKKLSFH